MTFVDVPVAVTCADELLGAAQDLIDRETQRMYASSDFDVSCRPNCNACCNHAVVVTEAETRAIAAAVRELPAETRDQIRKRADELVDRLAAEGLGDLTDLGGYGPDFSRTYYALAEPCPLLIDGSCAVRSARPLVCRDYLVSSAPHHCSDPELEKVVRIRRRNNVFTGFRAVSAAFGEERPQLLPLVLRVSPVPAATASRSGPRLALLLQTS